MPTASVTPSRTKAACVPEFVNVAPTPAVPFEYVAVKFVVVATKTESLTSKPVATSSTYAFVVNESESNPALSLYAAGTLTVPVP